MSLAISLPNQILTGLAILSIGLFVASFCALVAELKWRRVRQRNAERVYDEISPVIDSKLESPEELAARMDAESRAYLEEHGRREGRDWELIGLRAGFEDRITERMGDLRAAFNAVLDLSVEELSFLTREQESEIATLVTYVNGAEWNRNGSSARR